MMLDKFWCTHHTPGEFILVVIDTCSENNGVSYTMMSTHHSGMPEEKINVNCGRFESLV